MRKLTEEHRLEKENQAMYLKIGRIRHLKILKIRNRRLKKQLRSLK